MTSDFDDYYVYVYIDPRNLEEFYYGKGKGSRKDAHNPNEVGSNTERRIAEIHKEGLNPIVRVIARGLSQSQAFLIEATLLWKLGKLTTNVMGGHFAEKFRRQNTLHLELSGFDFLNGFYFYNVGDCHIRKWEDYMRYGFISGGQKAQWREEMVKFNEKDIIAAYINGCGYVGIGLISSRAKMIREVFIDGKPLLSLPLISESISNNSDDPVRSEYVCLVKWLKYFPREDAKKKDGIFKVRGHIRASLEEHPETVDFLEKEFGISVREMIR